MSKLLALIVAVGLTLGCDSAGLRANLETALCGVLPWYAADCTDPDVLAKAESILDNGMIEAQVTCAGEVRTLTRPYLGVVYCAGDNGNGPDTPAWGTAVNYPSGQAGTCAHEPYLAKQLRVSVTLFHDGTTFWNWVAPPAQPDSGVEFVLRSLGPVEHHSFLFEGGYLEVDEQGFCDSELLNPTPNCATMALSNCTGFNLEAFD